MLTKWVSLLSVLFLFMGIVSHVQAEQKQIKVVAFDFGGVFAKTDKQPVIDYMSQSLNISSQEAKQNLEQLRQYTLQKKSEPEFWDDYARKKNITLPANWLEKLNEVRTTALKENPGMIDLLKDLQRQGYQTPLLANTFENQASIKRKLGYYHLFNPVLLSHEIGARKPESQAYQILLSKLQVAPQAVIFIDDKPENIEAAKKLGIDGIVFINKDQLVQELKKRGIEISSTQSLPAR